jgi:hypothetical protein
LEINGSGSIGNGGGIDAGASNLLLSAGVLTTVLFLFSFGIFIMLAVKSRTIRSFQSQISLFAGVYVAGEILELNVIQTVTRLPADLGSQIHVAATIIITVVLWSRLFSSGKIVKKLVEGEEESANQK